MARQKRPRIDWGGLAAIIGAGVVPLLIALVILYVGARAWIVESVRSSLAATAVKTASALRLAAYDDVKSAAELARDARVRAILDGTARSTPEQLQDAVRAAGVPLHRLPAPSVALYDARGRVVGATSPGASGATLEELTAAVSDPTRRLRLYYRAESGSFHARSYEPMYRADDVTLLGFVGVSMETQSRIEYLLGVSHGAGVLSSAPFDDPCSYEIAVHDGDRWTVVSMQDASDIRGPRWQTREARPETAAFLERAAGGTGVTDRLTQHPMGRLPVPAIAAAAQVGPGCVLLAYRGEAGVYRNLHRTMAVTTALCAVAALGLAALAYRRLHTGLLRDLRSINRFARALERGEEPEMSAFGAGALSQEIGDRLAAIARGIRRRTEELEDAEAKYHGLVAAMRDGFLQLDADGVIELINPIGAEMLGASAPETLVGTRLGDVFADGSALDGFLDDLRERGIVERARVEVTRTDGARQRLDISGSADRDDAAGPGGMEIIFRDITQSSRLEEEVNERANRIIAINQIANAINSSLHAGRLYESLVVEIRKLVDFDFAAISVLAEAGDEFSIRRLFPEQTAGDPERCPVDATDWCAPLVLTRQALVAVDDLSASDAPNLRDFPEGTRAAIAVPLHASGRIVGAICLGRSAREPFSDHDLDVIGQLAPHVAAAMRNAELLEHLQASLDEVTLAQTRLHEANEELKTLDEMKTNLLSNVSHELRTPLVAVMGYTDMIYRGKVGPINDAQKDYLHTILRNIEKLVTLIENLLDFSRLHRGAETLVFDTFDLREVAQSSLAIVRPVAESREIALDLVAPEEPVLVDGDKGKIGQVFTNLLSNAVKFNHHSGSVRVELSVSEDNVEAIVSDTGVGIPQDALDRIFTRFYQYDSSSTRRYGGTGIGLSIAQDIARLHGTRISVESEVGVGTTFRFSLPLKLARKDRAAAAKHEPPRVPETHLLVEIISVDRALCTQVRMLLDVEDIDVITAGSSPHGIALARRHRPDCLLVDLEAGQVADVILDDLIEDPDAAKLPLVVYTSEDDLFTKYNSVVASRLKPGFRKSSLLSAIHYALGRSVGSDGRFGSKILCVDDDPEVLTFMLRCLEAEGFEAEACRSGEEALHRVTSREFGLVLLDVAMPGIDGWETCRRIKSDPSMAGIRIYMVTAKPAELTAERTQEAGSDGYLIKPFRPEELAELVRGVDTVRTIAPKNPA